VKENKRICTVRRHSSTIIAIRSSIKCMPNRLASYNATTLRHEASIPNKFAYELLYLSICMQRCLSLKSLRGCMLKTSMFDQLCQIFTLSRRQHQRHTKWISSIHHLYEGIADFLPLHFRLFLFERDKVFEISLR
jgi:hypothetical protein